jgi:predicted nucleic acid-binding protein
MAAFLDTNILLYAFSSVNEGQPDKVIAAKQLIDELILHNTLILSSQVLSEFVSVATRKGKTPLTLEEVAQIVLKLSRQTVLSVDATLVQLALRRVQESRISYWDALIVEAAIRSGATLLYTEDMHHGTQYGNLRIHNPFLP